MQLDDEVGRVASSVPVVICILPQVAMYPPNSVSDFLNVNIMHSQGSGDLPPHTAVKG